VRGAGRAPPFLLASPRPTPRPGLAAQSTWPGSAGLAARGGAARKCCETRALPLESAEREDRSCITCANVRLLHC
jgi:hypothetical protein